MSTEMTQPPPEPKSAQPSAQPPAKTDKNPYKDTLNLPRTAFPMEAKLVLNEPKRLEQWEGERLYEKILTDRASRPAEKGGRGKWVLHDGPPFANGDIHIGHLINKTLKDVILRFRTLQGYETPYVPGWDCHGLPIEHKIQQALGPKMRHMATVEVRRECHAYARKYVDVQGEQFKRLGILGEWQNPYLTMKGEYEAETLEVFARLVEKGLVYKKLKPVPWSIANQTALADAELEKQDVNDQSVYVEFPLADGDGDGGGAGGGGEATHLLVWTTTPWTLPANLAVAAHPDVEYATVRYVKDGRERFGIVAAALAERVFKRPGVERYQLQSTTTGRELAGRAYRHPFLDRTARVVLADYVTTTDGTGLVHTAPGHGEEDYETGLREKLEVYSPVLANGKFDETAPPWLAGTNVFDANPIITQKLRDLGLLLAEETIRHSYPHDWRSKTPIIFRATEQWFVAMDKTWKQAEGEEVGQGGGPEVSLRSLGLESCAGKVDFVPDWGRNRIGGMIESRPDWCISRQRAWGLPIPVFYNEKGDALLTPESVRAVGRHFRARGSDAWFTDPAEELLGADFAYPQGFEPGKLRKENDIFDVWFESGSSWRAVLQCRSYLGFPADLYLEGSDQHRGWFQLSLLPSLGYNGTPPFKQVLTHGFAVKPDGTKVSKSDKEYVTVTQEVERHGADLLRLWVCSVDYQYDIPTSPQVIQAFGDKYRKIRNTLRYLLSNLYDFNANADAQPIPAGSLDGWALAELDVLVRDVTEAYDQYQTHRAFRLLHDFCAAQISAVYGNAMKDRLYCEAPASPPRRRCQTVMHKLVLALTKLLSPMIVFTADETWEHIPHKPIEEAQLPSVHLALLPTPNHLPAATDQHRQEWKLLMELRDSALGQLDALKKESGLNKAVDAEVIYHVADADLRRRLEAYGADLEDLVSAGCHRFADAEAPSGGGSAASVKVVDRRHDYAACARSWKRRPDVGGDKDYPDLSARDAAAVKAIRAT